MLTAFLFRTSYSLLSSSFYFSLLKAIRFFLIIRHVFPKCAMFSPVAAMLWTPMIVIFREYTVSPCSPVFSDSCLRLYACIVLRFLCSLKWTRVQIKFNFFPFVFRFRNSCPVDRRAHNCLRKSVLALLYFAGVPGVSVWILRRLSYRKCTRPANSNRKTGFGKKKKSWELGKRVEKDIALSHNEDPRSLPIESARVSSK